jgi:hypothetical protein
MAFGRRAIQSNVLAHVAAAQTNARMKTAAGIFALRPAGLKIDWLKRSIRQPRSFED